MPFAFRLAAFHSMDAFAHLWNYFEFLFEGISYSEVINVSSSLGYFVHSDFKPAEEISQMNNTTFVAATAKLQLFHGHFDILATASFEASFDDDPHAQAWQLPSVFLKVQLFHVRDFPFHDGIAVGRFDEPQA